jgi:hypothetical protein
VYRTRPRGLASEEASEMAEKRKISPKAPEKSEAGEKAAVRVTKKSQRAKLSRRHLVSRRVSHHG